MTNVNRALASRLRWRSPRNASLSDTCTHRGEWPELGSTGHNGPCLVWRNDEEKRVRVVRKKRSPTYGVFNETIETPPPPISMLLGISSVLGVRKNARLCHALALAPWHFNIEIGGGGCTATRRQSTRRVFFSHDAESNPEVLVLYK